MRFDKLKWIVGISIVLFIFLVANIIVTGTIIDKATKVPVQNAAQQTNLVTTIDNTKKNASTPVMNVTPSTPAPVVTPTPSTPAPTPTPIVDTTPTPAPAPVVIPQRVRTRAS
jgi:hypothetical protein